MVDGGKRICAHDGCTNPVDDVAGRGRPRKYCDAHRRGGSRSSPDVLAHCAGCGSEFLQKRPGHAWCSRSCKDSSGGPACFVCGLPTARGGQGRRKDGLAKHHACFEHGTEYGFKKHGCRCEGCVAANRAMWHQRITQNPERVDIYNARRRAKRKSIRICRGLGRPISRGVNPRRRRHAKFQKSAKVRAAIYARDRFICHLCGHKVDVSLPGSDALGPTLDHVVPQAQGGTHDVDNLRLAHRKCNSIRRDLGVKDARAMLKRGVELSWLW